MPLESVVYPQDPLDYLSTCKDFTFQDLYYQEEVVVAQDTKNNINKLGQEQSLENDKEQDRQWRDYHQYPLLPYLEEELGLPAIEMESPPPLQQRRKRRRTRSNKNVEEIENQRMTHIAVERNRRKQMNEYLAVLRSLMPTSYAQRGDQASIVGGAINYVKELEHILQSMEPKRITTTTHEANTSCSSLVDPFSDFFSFPQYSTKSSLITEGSSSPAEIEVTVAEGHANIKIMVKKKPKQLLKLVASIQSLRLTLLHLNVTTLDNSILYSISVKGIQVLEIFTVVSLG
ncbi:transcription factor bHLH94 isoform X2 [Raphanus sativus]|uniref:Transcription factor bHLH94 isoform X2 n=1 Tax=Raphanus sativus TaxID=3726 RepID=A0A9W3C7Q3_RAPSA|nr:transcription factor bHLH94 isoform X2 [Raphanus sativus]XP_056847566.1 transcription factor bHLH94 isoform X2 [Raphanus sativus]XP_056847567.1 transcription factor bHLH94 isoform X2 [Raphanus sativus]XP_056847568.1 transcription factor bHLH94 isoform X2 [Raphanus sativus]XP_056847569.1 transcription factor bHLH94 isoform X2 [Raphanus sativus]